jgi:hypothetical protein
LIKFFNDNRATFEDYVIKRKLTLKIYFSLCIARQAFVVYEVRRIIEQNDRLDEHHVTDRLFQLFKLMLKDGKFVITYRE